MKKNHQLALGILWILIFVNAKISLSQNTTPAGMLIMRGHIVKSSFNNKSYQLYVSLPKNYSATDTLHYPVLYVLDGTFSFASFSSIRQVLDMGREIEDVIIVAIGDSSQTESDWLASRYTDYTPSYIPQADTMWTKMLKVSGRVLMSGGAGSFLKTLQKEIIPFIDKQYKTNGDRGLSGHSLGGLFVGYCLLSAPELFSKFAMNSPSLWWNNNELLHSENSFAKQHPALPVNIFMSVGRLEGTPMISPMSAFADSLKAHHYEGLSVTTQVFDDETHVSVVPACSSRTLKVLYRRKIK